MTWPEWVVTGLLIGAWWVMCIEGGYILVVRWRRMRWALQTIGTRCTSYTGRLTCWDDLGRTPDAEYGAERWCDACIARRGLE